MKSVLPLVVACAFTVAGVAGCAKDPQAPGGTASGGVTGSGGMTSSGGVTGSGGGVGSGGVVGSLPRRTVMGTKLKHPSGNTIMLRGSSMIDIGALSPLPYPVGLGSNSMQRLAGPSPR